MSTTTPDTKLALVRAAERLFAERGVDAVSLTEISKAAGQANHSAAHYHFGDKGALIDAIIERHSVPIQAGWMATLEHLGDELPLRDLLALLVRPIVAKLDDDDGGPEFIIVSAQLASSPTYPLMENKMAQTEATGRLVQRILERIVLPHTLKVVRMQRVASTMYHSIAQYHRTVHVLIDRPTFVEDLIDCLLGMIVAPAPNADA